MIQRISLPPPNTAFQLTGWIGAILASRSHKNDLPIYQCDSFQPAAERQAVGWQPITAVPAMSRASRFRERRTTCATMMVRITTQSTGVVHMSLPLVRNNDVPYDRDFQPHLAQYHARLWEQLDLLPTLTPARITALLTYFFDLACHSQHIRNITLGRLALWALPRDWLLATIEPIAEPFFDEQDEWVYRRLIEVYWTLDSALVQRLAQRGLHNPDAEIRETAAECLETLVKCQRIDVHGEPDFHSWESGSSLSTNHTETPLM